MSRFDDLFWLVEVVEAGTLQAAAEKNGVTSAAVSKRIRLMEQRLGAKLLIRSTRRARTTEAGEMYYQRGKLLLDEFTALEDSVASAHERLCGTIRINAPLTFGAKQLVKPVNEFLQAYPDVQIKLHLDDGYIDILNSQYDLVIRIGELEDSSLVARRISSATFVCCASPEYLAKNSTPKIPQDLTSHNCLIYEQSTTHMKWSFSKDGVTEIVNVSGRLFSNNGELLTQSAAHHYGIVLHPVFVVQDEISAGRLVPLLQDYELGGVNIYAMYPSRNFLPIKIKYFIDFLKMRLETGYLNTAG